MTHLFSKPKAISSLTVAPMNWLSGFWKTIAIFSLNVLILFSLSSNPKRFIFPSLDSSNPKRSFAKVDFPLPLWPIKVTYSPRLTKKEILSITFFSSKLNDRFVTSTTLSLIYI